MKIIVSLLFGLASISAYAQEDVNSNTTTTTVEGAQTEQAPPEAKEVKTLKKIEVTGSYIKRVDEEGPAPVQTISNETITKSGYNSVADVLRDAAIINTAGEARESSLSTNPGAATAGIGPFSSDSILVLLDGNRLPKMGGSNSVDLNLIPAGAIERVEVLKDGASALYGSDAIGGVINIITKKDFDGGNVNLSQSASEGGGGGKTEFAGVFGKKFKNGSITGVYNYRHNDHLADADRDFTKVVDLPLQGSGISQQGTYTNNLGVLQSPNCPAGQAQTTANGGTRCNFDYSKYSWNMPDINQNSLMLAANYRVSDYFKTRTSVTGTYRDVRTRLAPAPGVLEVDADAMINFYGQTNVTPGSVVPVRFRLLEGGGTRDGVDRTTAYTLVQQFEGKIAGTWNWDVTGTLADSKAKQEKSGYADTRIMQNLINSGQYNLFAPAGQKGDLSAALINPTSFTDSSASEVRAIASGQILDNVGMAVGVSTAWQSYEEGADAVTLSGNTYGDAGGTGSGSRNFHAVFQELNYLPTENLEVSVAARYDNYNDFGETFNPKLGLSYKVSEKVLLRASVGTGFRAPNLESIYGGPSVGYYVFSDINQCAAGVAEACSSTQYLMNTFRSSGLQEETSIFYNAGFVAEPKKNWNIESNFFVARVEDNVGAVSGADIMRGEAAFGIAGMKEKFNIDIVRDPGTGELLEVSTPGAFNVAFTQVSGIDFRISNVSRGSIFGFPVNMLYNIDHIQYLTSEREAFSGTGVINGRDVAWKNTVSVTAIHNDHNVRLGMRTISGGDKLGNEDAIGVVGQGSLRTHTEFDLNYGIENVFKKMALNVGIKNVFNAPAPLDTTTQTFLDQSVYDPIGRYFYTSIGYNF